MTAQPRKIAAIVSYFCLFLAGAVVLALTWRAWRFPLLYYDGWYYHLPIASYLWNLGGGEKGYEMAPLAAIYYPGFPKLAEWLQGAGWVLTGSLRGTILPNILIGACLILYAAKYLRLNAGYLILAIFAFPLVLLHYQSAYIDFFVAGLLAIEVCAAFVLLRLLKLKANSHVKKQILFHSIILCASWAAVCESKITALPFACIILGFILLKVLILAYRRSFASRGFYALILGITLAALPVASWQYVWNAQEFANPFYPLPWSVGNMSFEGPYDMKRDMTYYPSYLPVGAFIQPVLFVLSLTEVDWLIRGIHPPYNIDMSGGDEGLLFIRTGGLYGPYVGILLGAFSVLLFKMRHVRSRLRRSVCRDQMFLFLLLTLVSMFLPLSHNLRYVLVWPIALILCIGVLLRAVRPGWMHYAAYVAGLCCIHNLFVLNIDPLPVSNEYVDLSPVAIRESMSPELQAAVDKGYTICFLQTNLTPQHFVYSAAVIGGTHVVRSIPEVKAPPECFSKKHAIFHDYIRFKYVPWGALN